MLVRELPDSGGEPLAERKRIARAVVLSFASARRRGLGCDWGGDRLLRNRARVFERTRTIRPADWRFPIGPGKIVVGGAGNYQGAIARVASHPNDGSRHRASAANLTGETQQCLDGAAMCPQSARHFGRDRNYR